VGNHEANDYFVPYRFRFTTPNVDLMTSPKRAPMWYSWDISNIHFVAFSTELDDNPHQYAWLQRDLMQANAPENRTIRPWIITIGHHPMYCSNRYEFCADSGTHLRVRFEELFHTNGVDLAIEAHMHSYERLWPVYKARATAFNYTNPKSPVHIITGSAGCNEHFGWCVNMMRSSHAYWSAYRMWLPWFSRSYSRMIVHNDTHLEWQQVLALTEDVIDSMMLVQTRHGPFGPVTEYPDPLPDQSLWVYGMVSGLLLVLCIALVSVRRHRGMLFSWRRRRTEFTKEAEENELL